MSWAEKTGKSGGGGVKIVEEENDFPVAKPNYMRIGSAHAVERGSDREALKALLQKFADAINLNFGQSPENNNITVVEK